MLIALVLLTSSATAANPADGRDAFQRFVDNLYTVSTPVGGSFTVTGKSPVDKEADERLRQAHPGKKFQRPPENRLLKCRWALDRTREVLDQESGSVAVFTRFYSTSDCVLDGGSKLQYTMGKSRRVPYSRPASFVFLSGSDDRWEKLLMDMSVTFETANDLAGQVIWARNPTTKIDHRLNLTPDGRLTDAHGYYDGKEIWTLTIHEVIRTLAGKSFPKRATIRVALPDTGRVVRDEELFTDQITFPKSPDEIKAAFALELPKGAMVADTQLRQVLTLAAPTEAAELVAHPGKHERVPMKTPGVRVALPDDSKYTATGQPDANESEGGWVKWYWAGVAFLALGCAALALRRAWRPRGTG